MKHIIPSNVAQLLAAIAFFKFYLIRFYHSIPIMDDRLLATFTYILVNIISFWINGAKMYLSKRPTAFVVSYICMLKYIFLTKK